MKYDVKNLKLADAGQKRIEWAAREMPVLRKIRDDFAKRKPLKNVKLAAASSSKNAPHLLKNLGISDYFTVIISGSDFTKPKPDPQIFTLTADKLKVPYKHVVVIEDAYHGALAGKKAGMRVIGLMTSNDEKLYTISDFVTDSLKNYQEVIEFLKI